MGGLLKSSLSGASYRLGRPVRLGRGTANEAFDAEQRRYWIKSVPASDEAAITALRYEAILLSRYERPGLIRLLDRGRSRDCFFLALEPVAGRPLAELLADGPLSFGRVRTIGVRLAELLGDLHDQGIICRALLPEAISIDHLDRPTLVDLSTAWDEISPPREDAHLVPAAYVAPEQLGGLGVDRRSDIYAFGVLLFDLLTGHPPFQSGNRGDLALKHLLMPPPDLRAQRPDVPEELAAIVTRCLEKPPHHRFPNAEALRSALSPAAVPG
jgi:serine/threonine-protein kinase